jgi:Tfp pilus assembly protein PilN
MTQLIRQLQNEKQSERNLNGFSLATLSFLVSYFYYERSPIRNKEKPGDLLEAVMKLQDQEDDSFQAHLIKLQTNPKTS